MTEPRSSCEVPQGPAGPRASGVLRHADGEWEGVPALRYRTDDAPFRGVTRHLLAAPDAAAFETRYFEVGPAGYTTHERHTHVHVVVCLRGRGRVRLGEDLHDVGFGDVVYVAPDEPHQFLNPHAEPFGFLCIVDRERDRPVPMGE